MKAYRFRLDSVLRVRQLQERVAAQQLAVAVRDLHCARAQLARARRALAGLDAPAGRLTVGTVEWSHAESDRMSETSRRSADEVETAGEVARQATQAWGSARQRTAMLERLDERHLTLWRAELDRSEAVERDDLTTGRKAREQRAMTISPVSLADIEQTMTELQQAPGVAQVGSAPASAVDGASGSGDDFATSLAQATGTGTGTTSDLFADAVAAGADPSADDLSSSLGSSLTTSGASSDPLDAATSGVGSSGSESDLLALLVAALGDLTGSPEGTSGLEQSATTAGTAGAPTTAGGVTGSDVVAEAQQFEGTPYVWGGTSPSGFDCSGLVQYVYGQLGVSLPRTSEEQAEVGTPVASLSAAQPGDLLFFAGSDGTASSPGHVGIYVGNGQMIDAPHTGTSVQVQAVPADQVVAIRQVLPDANASNTAALTSSTAGGPTQMGNVAVPAAYAGTIQQAAASNGIPASLLAALLYHESRFEPGAVSSAGAEGIAQFMPATAAGMGVDPTNPTQSIEGAAQLLGSYTRQFGSYSDALAAYDAGSSAVERYGGIPPYAETQAYVPAVLSLAGLSGQSGTVAT